MSNQLKANIILNMKKSKSPAQNHQRMNALCLNPDCICFDRHCSVVLRNEKFLDAGKNHQNCQKWLWVLNSPSSHKNSVTQKPIDNEEPDFLKQPLVAIESILAFGNGNWQQGINQIFGSIQGELQKKVRTVQERVSQKIKRLIERSQTAKSNMMKLKAKCQNNIWSYQHQHFYKQNLQMLLLQIQNTGLLRVINYEALSLEIDKIKTYINRIQWYFWSQQPEIDRLQRLNSTKQEQQLQKLLECKQMEVVNKKLQDIQGCLRLKQFCFKEKVDSSKGLQISLTCSTCNQELNSSPDPFKTKNKQTKRSECIIELYSHFCKSHNEEIIEKYIKKSSRTDMKLSLDQLIKQVSTNRIKTCVVIDRQNFNSSNQIIQVKETYVVQVVSASQQNLAAGRYLLAQSSGKDAADILIILILFELAKIDQKMRIILVTNDHYGKTLQPIYLALGARIEVTKKIDNELVLQMNHQNQQMIIE